MVGKDPHRIQGKTKDMEHMADVYASHDVPRQAPSDAERAKIDYRQKELGGRGARATGEDEHIGGSRPGVPSRVKEAIAAREGNEEDDA